MSELLPCPFCGAKPIIEDGRNDRPWVVQCPNSNCHAQPFMDHGDTRKQAIAAWNNRKPHENSNALRDYFAGQALAMSQPDTPAALANWAYRVADAMLAERKSHEADRAFKEAGL